MARIAIIAGMAIAGAAISVATGGLGTFAVGAWASDIIAGAAVGAAAGSVLSSVIFPPHIDSAPQLNNLQAMSSAYGSPICWGYGSYRIGGQVIWADQIKVHKTSQSVGGGKGAGPTTTVYTYTLSCALSFGFGPGSITRVWADSKLIYDKTGKGPIAIDTGLSGSNGASITTPFSPTFYQGTADQPPDPTIQAALGVHSTSGYRNQILMVLTDFPLADYGNRLPNMRCEITTNTGLSYVSDLFRQSFIPSPDDGEVFGPNWVSVDAPNRVAWVNNTNGNVLQRIDLDVNSGDPADPYQFNTHYAVSEQVLDINGNIQLCIVDHTSRNDGIQPPWATGFGIGTQHDGDGDTYVWVNMGPGPDVQPITLEKALSWPNAVPGSIGEMASPDLCSGADTGSNYWAQGLTASTPSNLFAMLRFNPNTLVNDKQVQIPYDGATGAFYMLSMNFFKSTSSGRNYAYCLGQSNNYFGVLDCDAGSWLLLNTWNTTGFAGSVAVNNSPPVPDPATGTAYLCLNTGNSWGSGVAAIGVINAPGGAATATIIPIDDSWETGGTPDSPGAFLWNAADKTLLLITTGGRLMKINPGSGAIIGTPMPVNTVLAQGGVAQQMCRAYNGQVPADGLLKLSSSISGEQGIVYVRVQDMFEEQRLDITNWLPALAGDVLDAWAYDALSDSFMVTAPATTYSGVSARIYLERQATASESLQTVVQDIWTRSGGDLADLDVSALAGIQVKGYPVTSQGTGRGILGPLMAAFFFDLVESDNQLKAIVRGQTVTTIIPEADLGLEKDQLEATPTIVQEHDCPLIMDVLYADKDQDYQQGKQTYRRPKTVKKTRNRSQISLPITLEAGDAIAIAVRALQTAWAERNQWEFKLWRMNYLTIDPTDVVQFTYKGALYQSRVGRTAIGQDKTMEITALSEDPRQYVATPPAAPAQGFNPGKITAVGQTVLFILDTSLLTDTDAAATGNSGYYWSGASRANAAQWPGFTLMNSIDNNKFDTVDVDTVPVIYGSVAAATPAPPTIYAWDRVTKISVVMSNAGTLTSDTKINVLNGANWFYLNGELMAFANATLQPDGITYVLDTLLRGLRGTEQFCGTHGTSETFVKLDAAIQRTIVPTSQLNTEQYFRGITFGQPATTSASTPVTLVGNDLKPYAPAQLKGTRS